MAEDLQTPFDVGVVMATVLRPTFAQALRSVYTQRFTGRIHVLVGVDRWKGDRGTLDALVAERPANVSVTVLDLGYSTSERNGGIYTSRYGGALKTILSYAANSRYVTYLDDDNWYAPDHLATMLAAIAGKDWAFSLRHFVDERDRRDAVSRHLGVVGARPRRLRAVAGRIRRHELLPDRQGRVPRRVSGMGDAALRGGHGRRSADAAAAPEAPVRDE